MSDPKSIQVERRSRNLDELNTHAVLAEIQGLTVDIRDRVARIEARQSGVDTAFVNNDIGRPDYDGHRKEHLVIKKQATTLENYKIDITKKLLEWFIVGAIVLLSSGLLYRIADIAKTIPSGG
jgi:hypothetical protein